MSSDPLVDAVGAFVSAAIASDTPIALSLELPISKAVDSLSSEEVWKLVSLLREAVQTESERRRIIRTVLWSLETIGRLAVAFGTKGGIS